MKRTAEAEKELREAKTMAADFSESRHKIITSALENIRVSQPFFHVVYTLCLWEYFHSKLPLRVLWNIYTKYLVIGDIITLD